MLIMDAKWKNVKKKPKLKVHSTYDVIIFGDLGKPFD